MTTGTAIRTARAFGACGRKGCRYVHVTALESDANDDGYRYVRDTQGVRYAAFPYSANVAAAMTAAGLVCPDHGATMTYRGVKVTYNPDKICDGRCMNAKRPNCDCSCSGENHGKAGCP